jgi:hypothetical protein
MSKFGERSMNRAKAASKVELLNTLVRVLDRQASQDTRKRALRSARLPREKRVLVAIKRGENTWERLHAYFPETYWTMLVHSLELLQRQEKIHRDNWGTFRIGPRKGSY